jgi:hypothetical protein
VFNIFITLASYLINHSGAFLATSIPIIFSFGTYLKDERDIRLEIIKSSLIPDTTDITTNRVNYQIKLDLLEAGANKFIKSRQLKCLLKNRRTASMINLFYDTIKVSPSSILTNQELNTPFTNSIPGNYEEILKNMFDTYDISFDLTITFPHKTDYINQCNISTDDLEILKTLFTEHVLSMLHTFSYNSPKFYKQYLVPEIYTITKNEELSNVKNMKLLFQYALKYKKSIK